MPVGQAGILPAKVRIKLEAWSPDRLEVCAPRNGEYAQISQPIGQIGLLSVTSIQIANHVATHL
jgi:hypothetical protein